MKERANEYYVVRCKRKNETKSVRIDSESADSVVNLVVATFSGRLNPPKDADGRYKKGIPHTKISIEAADESQKRVRRLTHGCVYNYSPTQVVKTLRHRIQTQLF